MKREVSPLKKHIEESPKIRALKEKRKKAHKRLLILLVVLLVTVVGGLIYAARYPKFQLTKIAVSGNQVIDTKDVVAVVEGQLSGMYAYVIPRRNTALFPKKNITNALIGKFPRFQTVDVERTNLSTLTITVAELRGHALWCGADLTAVTRDVPCYFTDDTGKIVSIAPDYSGNVYPRFYGGAVGQDETAPLGKTFIEAGAFQKLLDFQLKLAGLGFHVKGLLVGADDEDTFVLDLGQGKTAIVRFLKDDEYDTLVANLAAALKEPGLIAKLKSDMANLQYFDLRFTNKVYYKFSDDTTTAPAPDTSSSGSYETGH